MIIKLKILPAYQGDAININCIPVNFKILIDTGTKRTYSKGVLKREINDTDKFDLLVLTHTDEDHIGGLIKYFEDSERRKNIFRKIWYNNGKTIRNELIEDEKPAPEIFIDDEGNLKLSVKQGVSLENKLSDDGLITEKLIISGDKYSFGPVELTILSPDTDDLIEFYKFWEVEVEKQLDMTKASDYQKSFEELLQIKYAENGTLANKTSIAFILCYDKKSILLMGDAYPSVIEKNIRKLGYNESNRLQLDVVKVSHHGSIYGISPSLLNIIYCNNFVISTNGSNGLPFKECLVRIISSRKDKVYIYFNYKNDIIENIFSKEEEMNYNFEVKYLTNDNDYTITLSE